MSNFKDQRDDQIPLMNITYVKVDNKKDNVKKNDKLTVKQIFNIILTNVSFATIILLSTILIIYACILGPKNFNGYLASSKGYSKFGLFAFSLTLVLLMIAYTFKYLKTYFLNNEKISSLFSYLYVVSLYLTFASLALTFFSVSLRRGVIEKLKETNYGIIILSIVGAISLVMIILNTLNEFTKLKMKKMNIINIVVASIFSWTFSIGYSVLKTRYSLDNGAYIVFLAPCLAIIGLLLSLKKEKEEKFNYMKLLSDAFIFTSICLTCYIIFKYGLLNSNWIA